ncbi:hypothetical protein PG996_003618 [Apiospora saccharicola]|uniref:Uncharacterized protein n=1 Tax=Apiospora saccharicola TaxID=335842 RepID=A0ABR1W5M6_9PEZI
MANPGTRDAKVAMAAPKPHEIRLEFAGRGTNARTTNGHTICSAIQDSVTDPKLNSVLESFVHRVPGTKIRIV